MNTIISRKKIPGYLIILPALLIFNIFLTQYVINWNFIFTDKPTGFIDFFQHHAHAAAFVSSVENAGKTWRYNPVFMAGFPDLTLFDLDNKFIELAALLLNLCSVPVNVSVKLLIFLELLLEPFLLFFAFRNLGFSRKFGAIACLAGLLLLNGPVGLFFNLAGMFSFIFTAIFSFTAVTYFFQLLVKNNYGRAVHALVFSALGPLFHSTALLMTGIPVLVLILFRFRHLKKIHWFWTAAIAGATLVLNLYWIIPAIINLPYLTADDPAWTGNFDLLPGIIMWVGGTLLSMGGLFLIIYYGKGIRLFREQADRELLWLVVIMTTLALFSRFPGWYLTRALQPNRFIFPMLLYMLVPGLKALEKLLEEKRIMTSIYGLILLISIILPLTLVTTVRFGEPGENMLLVIGKKLFGRQLTEGNIRDPLTGELITWLNTNTSPRTGRIMLEHPQGEGTESPFMVYYLGLLPGINQYVKGEFLGAPRFETPLIQNRLTRFSHDEMFGVKIRDMDEKELEKRLVLYNVRWIVAIEGTITAYLDTFPELVQEIHRIGNSVIYRVNRESSYFISGSGSVMAGKNFMQLSNLMGNEVIIKYNWMQGLKTDPPVKMERHITAENPAGFIKLVAPPAELKIFY